MCPDINKYLEETHSKKFAETPVSKYEIILLKSCKLYFHSCTIHLSPRAVTLWLGNDIKKIETSPGKINFYIITKGILDGEVKILMTSIATSPRLFVQTVRLSI